LSRLQLLLDTLFTLCAIILYLCHDNLSTFSTCILL
jgi:hypothetical protein